MSLTLGKTFDRKYDIRVPFIAGYYNISVFFSKKSSFVLFGIEPDFSRDNEQKYGIKINMFKNLISSRFAEVFLDLHTYNKNNLDIINQFNRVKVGSEGEVSPIFNETITLMKSNINGKDVYDTITLYGFTMTCYPSDFIYVLAERQNIIRKLNKKIVRTTSLQIATSPAAQSLNEYYNNSRRDFSSIVDDTQEELDIGG